MSGAQNGGRRGGEGLFRCKSWQASRPNAIYLERELGDLMLRLSFQRGRRGWFLRETRETSQRSAWRLLNFAAHIYPPGTCPSGLSLFSSSDSVTLASPYLPLSLIWHVSVSSIDCPLTRGWPCMDELEGGGIQLLQRRSPLLGRQRGCVEPLYPQGTCLGGRCKSGHPGWGAQSGETC